MFIITLQEIQETLLPPSVHIYPKKKVKGLQPQDSNNGVIQANEINSQSPSAIGVTQVEQISNGSIKKSADSTSAIKCGPRSSSPYPNVWSLSLSLSLVHTCKCTVSHLDYTSMTMSKCLITDYLYSLLHLRSSGRVFATILEYIHVPLASSVSKLAVS